jgi:hypothetical protein
MLTIIPLLLPLYGLSAQTTTEKDVPVEEEETDEAAKKDDDTKEDEEEKKEGEAVADLKQHIRDTHDQRGWRGHLLDHSRQLFF